MKIALAVMLAGLPVAAIAQDGPYKLIFSWNSNMAVIDYPSFARCERARQAVIAEFERRNREHLGSLPPGAVVVGRSSNGAFCIPG